MTLPQAKKFRQNLLHQYSRGRLSVDKSRIVEERFPAWKWKTRKRLSLAEYVALADALTLNNNGTLPSVNKLRDLGHYTLTRIMRAHPECFSHIFVRRTVRPPEWLLFAKELAKEHGGVLPSKAWLKKNDHCGLERCMFNYPEVFSEVVQVVCQQPTSFFVEMAKTLALEMGELPGPGWLQANGYKGLDACIRRDPDAFSEIPRVLLKKEKHDRIRVDLLAGLSLREIATKYGYSLGRIYKLKKRN